jgi:RNA polymerase sigma factor (sigma-70 family)
MEMDDSIDACDSEECLPLGAKTDDGRDGLQDDSVYPLTGGYQRLEIIEEIQRCSALETSCLRTELREVIECRRHALPEVLVHLCRDAYKSGDGATLNLAFEALAKTTGRLLLSQAWGATNEERHEQAQEVLLKIFEAIRNNKADYAETNFNAFAKRRAIELYRARMRTMEGSHIRIEPTEEGDPVDDLPSHSPRHDYQALLAHALDKLSSNHRAVFIQYYQFGMTHEEIATHHQVTVRTVFSWLRKAEAAVGLSGDKNEH